MKLEKLFLAITILFIGFSASGQETILETRAGAGLTGTLCEEFEVLKSKKEIKHGSYLSYTRKDYKKEIYIDEIGQYNNNLMDSTWYFFNNNMLKYQLNLKNDTLHGEYIEFYTDTAQPYFQQDTFNNTGNINDPASLTITNHPLHPYMFGNFNKGFFSGLWTFCYEDGEIYYQYDYSDSTMTICNDSSIYFAENCTYPIYIRGHKWGFVEALLRNINHLGTSSKNSFRLKLTIDEKGNLENIEYLNSSLKNYDRKKIAKSIDLPQKWIPAKNADGNQKVDYYLTFVFHRKDGLAPEILRESVEFIE